MKTRITLLTLALAAVLSACTSSVTAPSVESPTSAQAEEESRDGMGMGNGN